MTRMQSRTDADETATLPSEPAFPEDADEAIGLVTCLVVDLAESSAVLEQLGEGRVEASRNAYLTLLRNAVGARRGRELSRRGDRVLVAFDVPTDAVGCAVAVLRAAERHSRRQAGRLDLRIGIQLGEANEAAMTSERGEFIARPAIGAGQLCDAAAGGQILVSGLVSALTHAEASFRFERSSLLDVPGSIDPMPTFEVLHEVLPDERPPLPTGLAVRPTDRSSFVGRDAEREQLRASWAAAAAGERRLVLALGEPGIGKSRLAAEFAAEAYADGAVVLAGRSFEESVVPYQPFVEALRQHLVDCDPFELEVLLGGDPAALVALVPELATGHQEVATVVPDEGERYRMFDGVTRFLATISVSSPVLLVLDDLQWADPATLLLLKHVLLDPRPASMLILGLYRDDEVGMSHPLTRMQAAIERETAIDRVTLSGLADTDVAAMLDEIIGWSPPMDVARGLREKTEGNPFFLQEVIHQLHESGIATDRERLVRGQLASDGLGVPARIRDFVAQRLQRLAPAALEILGVAAIVGTEFSLDILAVILGVEPNSIVDDLEGAVEAGLVGEVPARAGTYAFTHALFQQTLHEGHGDNRRASLHARVAEAIETLRPDDPAVLSDLARHYALATGHYAGKVVHYGVAAGDRAMAGMAYEDAIEEYTRAIDALPLAPETDGLTKADLLIRLGEAQTRAGDAAAAKEAFLAAAEECAGDGGGEVLAEAALGYGGTGRFGGVFDPYLVMDETLVGLLDRAIEACPPDDEATRARLMGRLAQALYWSDDKDRMRALSREALAIARRIGDPTGIAYALHSQHVALWGPDHVAEVRAAAEEMLQLGESTGDRDIQLMAHTWLITDALETDSIEKVDGYIAGYTRLVEELQLPHLLGYVESIKATRAHLEGRFDDMARSARAQLALRDTPYGVSAERAYQAQMRLLELDIGRIRDELVEDLVASAKRFPGSVYGIMLSLALATLGRREEALAELARLSPDELTSIPRDCMWSSTLAMLARTVSRLGAVEYAQPLYDLLWPYAERNCLVGGGFMSFGPISRYLGMLATTLGDPDLALDHLEHALERCTDLGSRSLVARTRMEMARALARRAADGDAERAQTLLDEADRGAADMGMTALSDTIGRIRAELAAAASEVAIR